ncbi:MAG TPA: carboxyl transferase domain-containing protein [Actinomycetota bacterium]
MSKTTEPGPDALVDEGSFEPVSPRATSDPLGYPGYREMLEAARSSSGQAESVVGGPARIDGHDVELAWFVFDFLGGSMGEAAGEQLAAGLERAALRKVPFVLRTSTGGARMQEGMRALVQMPKVVTARLALGRARQPLIAVLGNPTTGGVLASIAALADVTAAEAEATVGFAGPRVAEAFTGAPLSGNSHSAQSAMMNGLVDMVVPPDGVRDYVARVLRVLDHDPLPAEDPPDPARGKGGEDPWDVVQAARSPERTRAPHFLVAISDASVQLRGDRAGTQDPAVVTHIARVAGRPFVAIALDSRFSPGPGGFRKARRCVEIASRLDLPIVTIVDTRGADPSEASENAGIAWEIARLFEAMLTAPVPILSIVSGEGGSGGALAFATADLVLAYESSVFSVIGPELAAQILWRDVSRAPDAARALRLTARDLVDLGIADGLLAEPFTADSLIRAVAYHLAGLEARSASADELVTQRQRRWRGPAGGN